MNEMNECGRSPDDKCVIRSLSFSCLYRNESIKFLLKQNYRRSPSG